MFGNKKRINALIERIEILEKNQDNLTKETDDLCKNLINSNIRIQQCEDKSDRLSIQCRDHISRARADILDIKNTIDLITTALEVCDGRINNLTNAVFQSPTPIPMDDTKIAPHVATTLCAEVKRNNSLKKITKSKKK